MTTKDEAIKTLRTALEDIQVHSAQSIVDMVATRALAATSHIAPDAAAIQAGLKAVAYDVLGLILATTTDPETAKIAADNREQFSPTIAPEASELPPLPEQVPELEAFWKCETCDGSGYLGMRGGDGFMQPPEPEICSDCGGNGRHKCEAYLGDQMEDHARAAIAMHQAAAAKPDDSEAEDDGPDMTDVEIPAGHRLGTVYEQICAAWHREPCGDTKAALAGAILDLRPIYDGPLDTDILIMEKANQMLEEAAPEGVWAGDVNGVMQFARFFMNYGAAAEPVPTITSLIEKHGSILHAANEQSRLATKPAASEAVGVEVMLQARSPEGDPWAEVSADDFIKANANGYETRIHIARPGQNSVCMEVAAPAAPTDAGVRDKALEDAARLVMSGCGYSWRQIADAIRALKSSPQAPKTEGGD